MGKAPREEKDDNYGQTPRDRDMQCDVCGVEKIEYYGLDILTGIYIYVGDKCRYMVIRDPKGYKVLP